MPPFIMRFKGCSIVFINIWMGHYLHSLNTCLELFMREVLGFRSLYKALCGLPLQKYSNGVTSFDIPLPTQGQIDKAIFKLLQLQNQLGIIPLLELDLNETSFFRDTSRISHHIYIYHKLYVIGCVNPFSIWDFRGYFKI